MQLASLSPRQYISKFLIHDSALRYTGISTLDKIDPLCPSLGDSDVTRHKTTAINSELQTWIEVV